MDNRACRRGLAAAGVGTVVIIGAAACAAAHPTSNSVNRSAVRSPGAAPAGPAHQKSPGLAAVESGLLPWHLSRPLSREVVVPGGPGQFVVLGGLHTGNVSTANVYDVETATGAAHAVGTLLTPLHDAGVGVSGGKALVIGGGTPTETGRVQSFPVEGGGQAAVTGSLPEPRSDSHGVTFGGTTYITGGFSGTKPDAEVLATTDGRAFTPVASLPVPVRYAATTVMDGQILLFGGESVDGPNAGPPVNVIQAVDPVHRTARVIGYLPEHLEGASAATVNGEVIVAGGDVQSSGSGTGTVSTIWAYDPVHHRLLKAGKLRVPVSYSAITVTGSSAFLVGGETNGAQVNDVQTLRPNHPLSTAG